jgi:hypothetical protein
MIGIGVTAALARCFITTSFTDYVTEFWVEGHRFLWNHYQTEGPLYPLF